MALCVAVKNFLRTIQTCVVILLSTALAGRTVAASSHKDTDASAFGFGGPETYPIDPFISQLRAADLDGDGLTDLIIANNSRSKITLLYIQSSETTPTESRS